MRYSLIPIIFTALVMPCLPLTTGTALAQAAPDFAVAGTDAARVTAFLKSLQSAVALGNRLKVATLVQFPLTAWVDGEETVVRNESEFQARYGRIFTADVKKAIADARADTLVASPQGVAIAERLWVRASPEHRNALRVVAINGPAPAR